MSQSYEVKDSEIRRAVAAVADLPSSTLPDSLFILALGTPAAQNVHRKLAPKQREPWRNGNAPVRRQGGCDPCADASRPTGPHPKDGGEMLIAIVLDRTLADAKALVDDPASFTREMTKILLEKQSHPTHLPQPAQTVAPAAMNTPAPVRQCSSSNLKRLTWVPTVATHDE